MQKKRWRNGITTGTCAAAAAKAALLALQGENITSVAVLSPQEKKLMVPIAWIKVVDGGAQACVIKDAGDDPDITNGTEIIAEVVITNSREIVLRGGTGVGIVTKPGLSVAVGQPAINPGPRQMILNAVREVLGDACGATVIISVPEGEKLAVKTMNPLLGIIGGISIIGTTGIVEPMSEEAFKNSLVPQINMVRAQGREEIVFVPGKIGWDCAVHKFGLPAEAVVQTSNFVGFMLEQAEQLGIKRVLLLGHLGKIIKVAGGIFYTHSRIADGRMEILAANLAAFGAGQEIVQQILTCTTTEAAMTIIEQHGMTAIYKKLAGKASQRAIRYVFGSMAVGTAIITMQGELLGYDETAGKIGGIMGWNIN